MMYVFVHVIMKSRSFAPFLSGYFMYELVKACATRYSAPLPAPIYI